MDAVVKYIDGLLEKSTPDAPVWNIEKIRQGSYHTGNMHLIYLL